MADERGRPIHSESAPTSPHVEGSCVACGKFHRGATEAQRCLERAVMEQRTQLQEHSEFLIRAGHEHVRMLQEMKALRTDRHELMVELARLRVLLGSRQ